MQKYKNRKTVVFPSTEQSKLNSSFNGAGYDGYSDGYNGEYNYELRRGGEIIDGPNHSYDGCGPADHIYDNDRSYDNNEQKRREDDMEKMAALYDNEPLTSAHSIDKPYHPSSIPRSYVNYAAFDAGRNIDSMQERCREAGVPVVAIPQSVIFELTNITNNNSFPQQDIVVHRLSNQDLIDKLNNDITSVDNKIKTHENRIEELIAESKLCYNNYTLCLINNSKTNVTIPVISLNNTVQTLLPDKISDALNDANNLFSNGANVPLSERNKNPQMYIDRINQIKLDIEKTANSIFKLRMDKIQLSSTLAHEQGKAIIETQNNPAHELSGDEILTNFRESYMAMHNYTSNDQF